MAVYKDEKTNTWKVYYRFTDWQGKVHQSTKRGFLTKREALAWEREQQNKVEADLNMTFESFIDTYTADMKNRLKENTWHTKEHIIRTKLLPYFAKRKINTIQPKDIIAWQNEMIKCRDKNGNPYSPVYLKTLHNQLSAIFNHAVKYYGLKDNPAAKVGNMGKAKAKEMLFWTQDEYKKFSEEMMEKPVSFYAFEMLYWCGIREGELLALTPADFDFDHQTVTINKSYQRIGGRDLITEPKTPKSNRTIKMPEFLCEEMKDYGVAQKRERLITIGIRNDLTDRITFDFPAPHKYKPVLRDILLDCPKSEGTPYSDYKKKIFELVPPGGYWRDIPEDIAKEYMKSCWYMEGGRTGILRRLSLDEPSLTVLTSPSQKQTDRCHPLEARPFTIRENARCQSFPDDWQFCGSVGSQYKQVGNAVPVNLALDIGKKIREALENL